MDLKELENKLKNIVSKSRKWWDTILSLLKEYNSDDWKQYVVFDNKQYTRNYVYKSDLFDIIVICWSQNQETKIHGHPEKWCYFKMLEWELQEDLYLTDSNNTKINILKMGDINYEHDSIWRHKVTNNTDKNAVWLYIYQSAWDYNPYK